ncbi:MAG: hypothetical protein J6P98_06160, partial [Clostridia bacterium]|nr:hypothetical protein [Clostridia bacterium]
HSIGCSGDCTGRPMTVVFMSRLRGMIKFDSPEELKAQLEKDRGEALALLKAQGFTKKE